MTLPDAPDIENLLIDWLQGALDTRGFDALVTDELQDSGESVAIFRVGGPRRDIVTDQPTITVEAKGPTKTRSSAILAAARTLIYALESTDNCGATVQQVTEVSGPAALPSADSPTRYSMTLSLAVSLI